MKRVEEQDLPGVLSPAELNSSVRFAEVASAAYFLVGQELLFVRDEDAAVEDLPIPTSDQYRLIAGVAFAEMAVRLKGLEVQQKLNDQQREDHQMGGGLSLVPDGDGKPPQSH